MNFKNCMSRPINRYIGIGLIVVIGLLLLIQSNVFYLTGYGYFDLCWTAQHRTRANKPDSPEQVLAQAKLNAKEEQCGLIANKTVFNDGYVFVGAPEYAVTPDLKKLYANCPSTWSDIPIFGIEYYLIDKIGSDNYLIFADRFLPAKYVIRRVMNSKWPNCSSVRNSIGMPMIKQQPNGAWEFDGKCKPCEDGAVPEKEKP